MDESSPTESSLNVNDRFDDGINEENETYDLSNGHGLTMIADKLAQEDDISVEYFCSRFNIKTNLDATNLRQVLDFIDVLIDTNWMDNSDKDFSHPKFEDLKQKIADEQDRNQELLDSLAKQSDETAKLFNENQELFKELEFYKDAFNSIQQENNVLHRKLKGLQEEMDKVPEKVQQLETTINDVLDFYNNQIDLTTKAEEQRNKLVSLCNRHQNLLSAYDAELQKSKSKPVVKEKVFEIPDTFVDKQYFLNYISDHLTYALPDSVTLNISLIRDSVEKSVHDRVDAILTQVIDYIRSLEDTVSAREEDCKNISKSLELTQENIVKVISMFEEELKFLQSLSTSYDVQRCILYRPDNPTPLLLDDNCKQHIIHHCVKIGCYLENIISDIGVEGIQEMIDKADPTEVFSFLIPNTLTKRLNSFFERMKDDQDPKFRELFAIYAAQVLSNNLLQNTCIELRGRLDLQTIETNKHYEAAMVFGKELKQLKKREHKIRKTLQDHIKFSEDQSTLSIIKDFVATHNASGGSFSDLESALNLAKEETQVLLKQANEKAEQKLSRLVKEFKVVEEQKNRLEKDLESTKDLLIQSRAENDIIQKQLSESNRACEDLSLQTANQISTYEMKLNKLEDELRSQIDKIADERNNYDIERTAFIQKLSTLEEKLRKAENKSRESEKKANLFEKNYRETTNKLKKTSSQIRDKCSEEIKVAKYKVRAGVEEINKLQDEMRKIMVELEDSKTKNNELIASNRTLELRLKSSEEKLQSQLQTIKTQTDAQVQLVVTQCREKINTERDELIKLLGIFTVKFAYLGITTNGNSLPEFLESIEEGLLKRKDTQTVYEETVADLLRVQKLLRLPSSSNIFDSVKDIHDKLINLELRFKEVEHQKTKDIIAIEKLRKELQQCNLTIENLKGWEQWARRMHRIVREASINTYSMNVLMRSLEEVILSSVNNRSLLNKLDLLRAQKFALTTYDNDLLERKSDLKASWRSIIAFAVWIKRVMRLSGYTPIDASGIIPSTSTEYNTYNFNYMSNKSPPRASFPLFNAV